MKLAIFDLDDTIYDKTTILGDSYERINFVRPFPETIPVLRALKQKNVWRLLVTKGDPAIQEKKIQIMGLRPHFEGIIICATAEEKLSIFRSLIDAHAVADPRDVFVIGDRIDSEITYGNMLGCTTVRLMHGKYKNLLSKSPLDTPVFSIDSLDKILSLC
jgi:FMN phosphatase YigB (HAD superfamily)